MNHLINVPTFYYEQGPTWEQDEAPIRVSFYNGGIISIDQGDQSVNIHKGHLNKIFRLIKKHLPDAEYFLKDRK